ncbi:hypothetical protein K239x_28170 [Planctomycetes bacterium K23_9]|uniref:Uncharacterized protein n=1 Tax=Stieleria marina TaxID=1930275 RepID=A0A517NUN3_9BACT|nr:hypothetical protein K239x_28170 [Planctomycetes bacterium K23_9]
MREGKREKASCELTALLASYRVLRERLATVCPRGSLPTFAREWSAFRWEKYLPSEFSATVPFAQLQSVSQVVIVVVAGLSCLSSTVATLNNIALPGDSITRLKSKSVAGFQLV